jgi:hypothetical protein
MTRTDVRKLAWTLRLIGACLLGGAFALMLAGAGRVTTAAPTAVATVKALQTAVAPPPGYSR